MVVFPTKKCFFFEIEVIFLKITVFLIVNDLKLRYIIAISCVLFMLCVYHTSYLWFSRMWRKPYIQRLGSLMLPRLRHTRHHMVLRENNLQITNSTSKMLLLWLTPLVSTHLFFCVVELSVFWQGQNLQVVDWSAGTKHDKGQLHEQHFDCCLTNYIAFAYF